jgi:hypothetical protein
MNDVLAGNDLQRFATKAVGDLATEVWPKAVRDAVASVHAEVEDHDRGIVTSVRVGNTYLLYPLPYSGFPNYERIIDRTPSGIRAMLREHLEQLVDPIEDAIKRAAR